MKIFEGEMTQKEISDMIKEMDTDGDGKINYNGEFNECRVDYLYIVWGLCLKEMWIIMWKECHNKIILSESPKGGENSSEEKPYNCNWMMESRKSALSLPQPR